MVFSSTTLALIVAVLSAMATVFSILERLGPGGALMAVSNGSAMNNTIDFHNNEKYPVILFGNIECDISGILKYDVMETSDKEQLTRIKSKIEGKIFSESSVERIVKPGEYISLNVKYRGIAAGFESEIHFQKLDDLAATEHARVSDGGQKAVDLGPFPSPVFSPSQMKSCKAKYRTPNEAVTEILFENRFIKDGVESAMRAALFK